MVNRTYDGRYEDQEWMEAERRAEETLQELRVLAKGKRRYIVILRYD